jgi:hypothetical protein
MKSIPLTRGTRQVRLDPHVRLPYASRATRQERRDVRDYAPSASRGTRQERLEYQDEHRASRGTRLEPEDSVSILVK